MLRAVRVTTFAVAAVLVAAAAHLAGGGVLPSWPALVLLAVPLAWGSVAVTNRVRGRAVLTVWLGAAQLVLHEAFMLMSAPATVAACSAGAPNGPQPPAAMAGMAGMPGIPGTGHGAPVPTGCAAGADGAMASMASMGHASALLPARPMLLAHVLATVLTALLLAHGERVLGAVGVLLARVLPRLDAATAPAVRAPGLLAAPPPARAVRRLLLDATTPRGPPLRRGVAVPA